MSSRSRVAVTVVVGLGASAALARSYGTAAEDIVIVVSMAVFGSLGAAALGDLASRLVRGRRVQTQVLVIALVATATTAAGVLAAARWMFIAKHDLAVLSVVLTASCAVAIGAATRLSGVFERDAENLVRIARRLVEPAATVAASHASAETQEMQRLATELHLVSERLDQSRLREAMLDASRRELVAWVSHDLRSPIAAIRAMAEALEDAVVDDQVTIDRYHRAIRMEAERLGELVDDLFELSRLTAGASSADDTMEPLAQLIDDAVQTVTEATRSRRIEFSAELARDVDTLVPGSHLRRALFNVLDNAIRHTPDGGKVSLSLATRGEMLCIDVLDECGGIPDEDLPRVFDLAFRGDVARSRDVRGGGLGLTIARGLLDLHDGSIAVANRGHGCQFTLSLPKRRETLAKLTGSGSVAERPPSDTAVT